MPTGYTAPIQKGCTFKEFLFGCADMRDEPRDEPQDKPIPDEFKPSDYHLEERKKAEAELAKLRRLTIKEADKRAGAEYLTQIDYINTQRAKNETTQKQYKAMLEEAKAWQPPSAEHVGLRNFMIQQIEDSAKFDDMGDYYEKQQPVKLSGLVWREKKCAEASENIGYHAAEYVKECERVAGGNQWMRQLRGSLPKQGDRNETL